MLHIESSHASLTLYNILKVSSSTGHCAATGSDCNDLLYSSVKGHFGAAAVVVVNELRSESVHNRFTALFEQHFTIKKTLRSKMDPVHQHTAIDILILKRRKAMLSGSATAAQSKAA